MSDYIPFDIQREIIKRVLDVKSLIRFRSVSKPWKSFIDTSEFIVGYRARKAQQPHILFGKKCTGYEQQQDPFPKVTSVIEQLNDTVVYDLLTNEATFIIDYSRGLLCLYAFNKGMLVLLNPSIRRSVGILGSNFGDIFGFAVCSVTNEPTIVRISSYSHPWKVEIFTLTSKRWTVIQCSKPREIFYFDSTQVVIGNCIYRVAHDFQCMILSFDLIAKEFRAIDLPDKITKSSTSPLRFILSKLKGSLFVFAYVTYLHSAKVWKMEPDCSFTQLFTVTSNNPDLYISNIWGFTKNGEVVVTTFGIRRLFGIHEGSALEIYDPSSQQISNLGVSGRDCVFFLGYYKETLLLLDHPDSGVYPEVN